jgi:hypothetical protein
MTLIGANANALVDKLVFAGEALRLLPQPSDP